MHGLNPQIGGNDKMQYTAQINLKGSEDYDGGRMTMSPIFSNIKQISEYVRKTTEDKSLIDEVVILKLKSGRTSIHGFYDWKGDRLRLNPNKPTFIHNILYGL